MHTYAPLVGSVMTYYSVHTMLINLNGQGGTGVIRACLHVIPYSVLRNLCSKCS